MAAGLGAYGGPMDLLPILLESGEVDGAIFLSAGWVYPMIDPLKAEGDLRERDRPEIRALVDQDVDFCRRLAEYARVSGKPLLIHSNVARLAIRRRYPGLLEIIQRGLLLYPDIESVIRGFSALAERKEFLTRAGRWN